MSKTSSRDKALLETIRRGLQRSAERQTQALLGDRTAYIGMSDLGGYAECPRAAVANKLSPQPSSLKRLLTLQRGHWFEQGVGDALAALNSAVFSQLEIRHNWQKTPIRAHLDFTGVWTQPMPAVRILEVKSTEKIPEIPRNSHVIQAQGQVCLLRKLWNSPVFTLRDANGTIRQNAVTFPQLCRNHFDLELPANPRSVSIESWLLCLSMKDARAFGPYGFDPDALEQTLWLACDCWRDVEAVRNGALALNDVPHVQRGIILFALPANTTPTAPSSGGGRTSPNGTPLWSS